jgi:hypothetical protein
MIVRKFLFSSRLYSLVHCPVLLWSSPTVNDRMPITFGSVGDIISISLLIKDAVKALDDSRGSAHEYQGVIRELWSLDRVLLEVELLSRNYGQTAELNALCVTAKRVADETRKCVENFLERIKKYDARLGDHATKNGIRGVSMKIKWRLMEKDELDKFRAEISADRESMSFLLATASVYVPLRSLRCTLADSLLAIL